MKVTAFAGREDLALVYIGETREGHAVEFLESVQPPLPREKKWVIIVSTLFGCPIGCPMCDAGGFYKGKLTAAEIFAQIDYVVRKRFPDNTIPVEKFKIQFARMGEPALNNSVLDVLEELPNRYNSEGLIPCISTVAPDAAHRFFDRLLEIKKKLYRERFQLQFSIHTTDQTVRDRLMPVKKWGLARIADYGEKFFDNDGKKITLNFALTKDVPIDAKIIRRHFDTDIFLIKVTPLNPTYRSAENKLVSELESRNSHVTPKVVSELRALGYEVIESIGELDENSIGSNCGQYITNYMNSGASLKEGYSYNIKKC